MAPKAEKSLSVSNLLNLGMGDALARVAVQKSGPERDAVGDDRGPTHGKICPRNEQVRPTDAYGESGDASFMWL